MGDALPLLSTATVLPLRLCPRCAARNRRPARSRRHRPHAGELAAGRERLGALQAGPLGALHPQGQDPAPGGSQEAAIGLPRRCPHLPRYGSAPPRPPCQERAPSRRPCRLAGFTCWPARSGPLITGQQRFGSAINGPDLAWVLSCPGGRAAFVTNWRAERESASSSQEHKDGREGLG